MLQLLCLNFEVKMMVIAATLVIDKYTDTHAYTQTTVIDINRY